MDITIDNKQYTLNVNFAMVVGALKERITEIKVGDVYALSGNGAHVCFIESSYRSGNFHIIGLDGLKFYSESIFNSPCGATKKEASDWLNRTRCKFVRNINDAVNKLIKD